MAPGIYQGVLGGNHDEWNMYLGRDYLKYFIDNRADFLSLDYRNAIINLKNNDKNIADLIFSHPNEKLDRHNIEAKVNSLCSSTSHKKRGYYFCFLGHSHESYLDMLNRVCAVPSFSMDRNQNGAWHIRIYYNEEEIDYMHLKPLVLDKVLKPISEIVYKK